MTKIHHSVYLLDVASFEEWSRLVNVLNVELKDEMLSRELCEAMNTGYSKGYAIVDNARNLVVGLAFVTGTYKYDDNNVPYDALGIDFLVIDAAEQRKGYGTTTLCLLQQQYNDKAVIGFVFNGMEAFWQHIGCLEGDYYPEREATEFYMVSDSWRNWAESKMNAFS